MEAAWDTGRITHLVPLKNGPACRRCHGYTDAEVLGVLRLTGTLTEARGLVRSTFLKSAALGAGIILITALAALLLVRRELLQPLGALTEAARRWREGALGARAPERPKNEIGDLGRSLNRMAERLQRNLAEVENLVAQSQTGMVVVDPKGTILFANPAAAELMDRSQEALVGSDLGLPLVEDQATEIEIRRGGGDPGVAELSAHPTEWEGQEAYLVTFHDVTEREQAEAEARYQAFHDDLTGLPNRAEFRGQLQRAIKRAAQRREGLALLFLDLDRFKEVNDTLGHAVGDELLQAIARRLRQAVRDTDVVARMSGDEFTVLLEGVGDRETARQVAEKLRRQVFTPVVLSRQELTPMGTIGVSLYPEDGDDAETLLMQADTAMYNAKEAGRNRTHTFASEQGETASRRFRLEQALQRAQANGEFAVAYQPQVRLADNAFDGVEALLRWEDPEEGTVSPADFIPLLEESGLIHAVGEWVFRQAAADLRAWDAAGATVGRIWINVAARQLASPDLVERLDRLATQEGLDPNRFGIELTESSVTGDIDGSIRILNALRERGFHIAMDDFGTGFSALTFLRRLPFDEVKIDRAFVQDLPEDAEDSQDRSLVRAIIAMSHGLGLAVVAEGVETGEQADCLRQEGCELAQGFLFARPMSAERILELLRSGADQPPTDTER